MSRDYALYYKFSDFLLENPHCSTQSLANHMGWSISELINWLPIRDIIQEEERQRLKWEIERMNDGST